MWLRIVKTAVGTVFLFPLDITAKVLSAVVESIGDYNLLLQHIWKPDEPRPSPNIMDGEDVARLKRETARNPP